MVFKNIVASFENLSYLSFLLDLEEFSWGQTTYESNKFDKSSFITFPFFFFIQQN